MAGEVQPPATGIIVSKTFAAGAVAGLVEVLCLYPADAVKTRLQLRGSGNDLPGTVRALLRERALYRGLSVPLSCDPPKRALKFASHGVFARAVCPRGAAVEKMAPVRWFLSGGLVGVVETVFEGPFENVKVRLQAGNRHLYGDARECLRAILAEEGAAALYRGFAVHCARNVIWNSCYFGISRTAAGAFPSQPGDSKARVLGGKFLAGLVAGGSGSFLNTPLDVVKSRIQRGTPERPSLYAELGAAQSLRKIYREEGLRALYHGLQVRVFRFSIGGGIMVLVFDTLMVHF